MRKELIELRRVMKEEGVDVCLIPTSDYHGSEYVGDYFKCREYVSGFTGSAGTLLVSAADACLWTDGRYFIQAADQLDGSGIRLMKMGEPGVPTLSAYLKRVLLPGMTLAYDGRCVMESQARLFRQIAVACKAVIRSDKDLPGMIWTGRPPLSKEAPWILDPAFAGQSRRDKIRQIRADLSAKNAGSLLLASLCDICWLLNVRGNDVACTPVVLSYLFLSQDKVIWYVQDCLSDPVRRELEGDGVTIRAYEEVFSDLERLTEGSGVYYDPRMTSDALVQSIPDSVRKVEGENPTLIRKAVKNPVEVENERLAHIKDGAALTRFIYWLKKHAAAGTVGEISEMKAAGKIGSLRRDQDHFVEDSFDPIIAYGAHAAICHYSATEETDIPLEARGFVLADTGGHYLEGSTDVTRTISLGPLTQEEKEAYTLVLRGHVDLAAARFLHGCTGQTLDALARTPLWDRNMDYNHGTGHGVGYLLGVHEDPNGFRYRSSPQGRSQCVLEEGMITSNEPGLYLEGKFGVRIENLIVCRKDRANGFGNFMCFETLTMAPYDRDAIITEMLDGKEIRWINSYHEMVYEKIGPLLDEEERAWLREETRPL